MRSLAATFLALAAFATPVPFLDRAGVAAIGFAFMALALYRPPKAARPAVFAPRPRLFQEPMPEVEPVTVDLTERLHAYSLDGDPEHDGEGFR